MFMACCIWSSRTCIYLGGIMLLEDDLHSHFMNVIKIWNLFIHSAWENCYKQCAVPFLISVYHAFTQFFPLKQVTKESGPPHMKSFVTKVSVGEFMGEGEGKSKKISKKNAAIAVLEELKKLPPLPTVEKMKPRIKKKTKSIVKVRDNLTAVNHHARDIS